MTDNDPPDFARVKGFELVAKARIFEQTAGARESCWMTRAALRPCGYLPIIMI
jgi:hypothetical protein